MVYTSIGVFIIINILSAKVRIFFAFPKLFPKKNA